jgi:hypothetical protein
LAGPAGTPEEERAKELRENVGLCAFCRHVRTLVSDRGSTFYQCRLAATDERFAKFPRLPMRRCSGYEGLQELLDSPA